MCQGGGEYRRGAGLGGQAAERTAQTGGRWKWGRGEPGACQLGEESRSQRGGAPLSAPCTRAVRRSECTSRARSQPQVRRSGPLDLDGGFAGAGPGERHVHRQKCDATDFTRILPEGLAVACPWPVRVVRDPGRPQCRGATRVRVEGERAGDRCSMSATPGPSHRCSCDGHAARRCARPPRGLSPTRRLADHETRRQVAGPGTDQMAR
ncbi:hypothetical protein B0T11DRAFT_13865 [Plectosphaerella cucumerina]|uniref:Uncharacterized protein n=1 Tax=Plectosphaerella cucumerina TaxID=40658 RepID=A0A8K0TVE5_9PEZI|nr:hypothetical protein B0T11DRAFT_13865 [Plectosphaerella cucumerina]